ncbi:hypothetical protein ERO13_D08G138501v2 [Gossypium hirsutum]|uniref:Protein RALF-like 33 n=1 Tax=Gossypium hirsutum TaxID=3635 RepID=A0A1U8KLD5_GOSHI|nr:protein RALF-like 33 [Gossypium hirsutum]KAG4134143.1 hypothetical protein ERO13_D08G138501v2 [Gossypium hirsutum]
MANTSSFLLGVSLVLTTLLIDTSLTVYSSGLVETEGSGFQGWMAECMAMGELEMESEISRRALESNTRYISYGALQGDTVPCSRRGASYYNCQPGADANPSDRGCSAINRCRH